MLDRRRLLAVAASAVLSPSPASAATQWHPAPSATTRAAAWLLGDNLSLAALLAAAGGADAASDVLFRKATNVANSLGISLGPLPARGADKAASLAAVSAYLIEGGGAEVGEALATRYDAEHRTLYELASRTNLLVVLYAPADTTQAAETIERRAKEIALPDRLWMPLVSAIHDKQGEAQIKDLVFRMHKEVADFLVAKVK